MVDVPCKGLYLYITAWAEPHVNHISHANTWETKSKKSYLRGLLVLHTLEQTKTDHIKCIVKQPQPVSASHLVQDLHSQSVCAGVSRKDTI
jgi:hypothetical protein